MNKVKLFGIRTENVRSYDIERLARRLPERVKKAERYKFESGRLRSLGAGILMVEALGLEDESELKYLEDGKPYAPGYPDFNISHSGDWCIMAIGEGIVGADVEEINPKHLSVAKAACTEAELEWMQVDPVERFFKLWVIKESVMKATGQGMKLHPKSFDVLPLIKGECITLQGKNWYANTLDMAGYQISVCKDSPVGELTLEELIWE